MKFQAGKQQSERILFGESAPELFSEDYKINHNVRDTLDNFTDLGKKNEFYALGNRVITIEVFQ